MDCGGTPREKCCYNNKSDAGAYHARQVASNNTAWRVRIKGRYAFRNRMDFIISIRLNACMPKVLQSLVTGIGIIIGVSLLMGEIMAVDTNDGCNPIPPRLQWEANGGYCGEVSLISAGLYYGQYLSQYDARACAIGKVPQNRGELLLGVNDQRAAARMALHCEEWNAGGNSDPRAFLKWVKHHVMQGHPVIIGVFTNEYLFYGIKNPNAGDPEYDHIVPVIGMRSGEVIFSDNGLFGSVRKRPYIFEYPIGQFVGSRNQANAPDGAIYTLPDDGADYGIAILGVADVNGDTLPVRVDTNRNFEQPSILDGSSRRPAPMPLTLRVTVSGLDPGGDYLVYRYDRLTSIPKERFNARASKAVEIIPVRITSGSSITFTRSILSSDQVAFRCVRATAP